MSDHDLNKLHAKLVLDGIDQSLHGPHYAIQPDNLFCADCFSSFDVPPGNVVCPYCGSVRTRHLERRF